MMTNYPWLDEYLLSKPKVEKEYKEAWKMDRYLIGGKQFAGVGGDKDEKPIITLKIEPLRGEALRREYADIVPGYYSNKLHYNSVYLEGAVPEEVLRSMIDESYALIFTSLPKKVQKALREE